VDSGNARMLQTPRQLGFANKTLFQVATLGQEQFEGQCSAEVIVVDADDASHAAARDLGFNTIAADAVRQIRRGLGRVGAITNGGQLR
jgi:hypothetical protein